jgi:hypothetical protein
MAAFAGTVSAIQRGDYAMPLSLNDDELSVLMDNQAASLNAP